MSTESQMPSEASTTRAAPSAGRRTCVTEGAGKVLEGAGGALKDGVKGLGGALEGVFGGKK